LMGSKHIVLAVNKIDLVDYEQRRFEEIKEEFLQLTYRLNFESIQVIPISATEGDNVKKRSVRSPWYKGEALLPYLENIEVKNEMETKKFVMPVQRVSRPNHTFRGFQGQIEAGNVKIDDEIIILPSKEKAKIKNILVADKKSNEAFYGQPVT